MFALDQIVPWGRSFQEYRSMFALDSRDLRAKVLGCADGPASFNAEATLHGHCVVSCDPLYRLSAEQIKHRIAATYGQMIEQARRNQGEFVWEAIPNIEELGRVRMEAKQSFLRDYNTGKKQQRYVDAELPSLPFPDLSFGLALCSHFLFLYSDHS
jgi:hypothetical protein